MSSTMITCRPVIEVAELSEMLTLLVPESGEAEKVDLDLGRQCPGEIGEEGNRFP